MKWTKTLLALAFCSGILATACFASGPAITRPLHPDKEKKSAANQTPTASQPAFDGKALYKDAFEKIRAVHIYLYDPKERAKWEKEWETKFDNTDAFKTEEGTDKALLKLNYSLKQRYDYFFDRDATKAENEQVDASLVGIGATLRMSNLAEIVKGLPEKASFEVVDKALLLSDTNRLVVEEPLEGGPADKGGVKPGDVIVSVDGKTVNGSSLKDTIARIKGKAGTNVVLKLERKDADGKVSTLEITLTRAVVTVKVVKFTDLGDGVSHVRLRDFMSKNAVTEMHTALKQAAKGKALIVDLRGNGGGSLTAVLTMLGMVIKEGPIMVTKYRQEDKLVESEIILQPDAVERVDPNPNDPSNRQVSFEARTKLVIPEDMPIVVLIDEGSASASEIFSGAVQHNRRGIIVGKASIGKGVGQNVVDLLYGRRLHITTFEFIPGRTPNNWIGVVTDVEEDRGDDPKVDKQLNKAKELAVPMIAQVEKRKKDREALKTKHEQEFEKQLQEREKK